MCKTMISRIITWLLAGGAGLSGDPVSNMINWGGRWPGKTRRTSFLGQGQCWEGWGGHPLPAWPQGGPVWDLGWAWGSGREVGQLVARPRRNWGSRMWLKPGHVDWMLPESSFDAPDKGQVRRSDLALQLSKSDLIIATVEDPAYQQKIPALNSQYGSDTWRDPSAP